ncbi:MAG: hypothetical protein LJE85_04440 [Gammaproteobacteria bacterium]|nr:hypothetical protein [Gammaproteobacteria bacterium]
MKKKVRKIIVDKISYSWTVQERFWPEGYLKLWIEGQKTRPWLVIEFGQLEEVTPSLVASIVKQANDMKAAIKQVESNVSNCKYENELLTAK